MYWNQCDWANLRRGWNCWVPCSFSTCSPFGLPRSSLLDTIKMVIIAASRPSPPFVSRTRPNGDQSGRSPAHCSCSHCCTRQTARTRQCTRQGYGKCEGVRLIGKLEGSVDWVLEFVAPRGTFFYQLIASTHSIRLEVIRAWVEHKWKFPLVRGLLHAATTAAAKDETKKEKVEVYTYLSNFNYRTLLWPSPHEGYAISET